MKKAIPWVGGFIVLAFFTFNRQAKERDLQKSIAKRGYLDTALCFINPSTVNKSYTRINIFYPCKWKSHYEPKEKGLFSQYYNTISDSSMVAISISVDEYTDKLTPQKLKKIQTDEFAKFLTQKEGNTFISRKSISVCGFPTEEITFKSSKIDGLTAHSNVNYIYAPSQLITITYMVVDTNGDKAKTMMQKYTPLFQKLRNRSSIIN